METAPFIYESGFMIFWIMCIIFLTPLHFCIFNREQKSTADKIYDSFLYDRNTLSLFHRLQIFHDFFAIKNVLLYKRRMHIQRAQHPHTI